MTTTTSDRDKASLSGNLPAGFDPATELARLKGSAGVEASDDAEQSNAPQHQSDEAIAAAGNTEERARYLSFVDGPTLGAQTDAIARHGKFGDFSINNGGGAITEVNGITAREREEEEDKERADEIGERLDEVRREQHDRWKSQMHDVGIDLTDEEWDDAADTLSDPAKRERLRQNMMQKKGWSAERTDKAMQNAEELMRIYDKTKAGTATEADFARAKEITTENPDARVVVEAAAKDRKELGRGAENSQTIVAKGAGRTASAEEFSRQIASMTAIGPAGGDEGSAARAEGKSKSPARDTGIGKDLFASAPDLKSHHVDALAATEPLDAAKRKLPAAAPMVVAQLDLNSTF